MATYQNITDNAPDGAMVGLTASSKVGFFGATPVVQQGDCTAVTLATTGGAYPGWADATALRDAVNILRGNGLTLGLTA